MNIRQFARKINNMLSRGKLLELKTDSKVPLAKVGLMANEIYDGVEYPQQFGFKSYPPVDSEVITAHFGGNRSHATILNAFKRDLMPDDLESGEVSLYNGFHASVKLDKNSNVVIKNENITLTINNDGSIVIDATTISISGSLNIVGDLVVGGTINGV